MAVDTLGIGISGIKAYQQALAITSNNIVNANTPGYSRQELEFVNRDPQLISGHILGTGVEAGSIRRSYNDFFARQLHENTSNNSKYQTLLSNAEQLDSLLADTDAGLGIAMQRFFGSIQGVADDPSSIPARQVMLSQSSILEERFNQIDQQMRDFRSTTNEELQQFVQEINALSESIANVNNNIVESAGLSATSPPNDLYDQRDQLIVKLSEFIDVTTVPQQLGVINVFIGTGEGLVVGTEASKVSASPKPENPDILELNVEVAGKATRLVESSIGGRVQGLVDYREKILVPASLSLGRIALGLSEEFNTQHKLGMDLSGNLGSNYFNDLTTVAGIPSTSNSGTGTASMTIDDVDKLKSSGYQMLFNGTQFTITRLSDNASLGSFNPGTIALASEGFTITTTGTPLKSDEFLLQPTGVAAREIKLLISNTVQIAAAVPIRASTSSTNTGTGVIAQGTVTSVSGAEFTTTAGALTPPILVRFTSATTYDLLDNTNPLAPVALAPPQVGLAYVPGQTNNLIPAGLNYGYQVTMTGNPSTNDEFTIDYNSGGTGDNRNMIKIAELQTKKSLNDGTATFNEAFGSMVAEVGNLTNQAGVSERSTESLLRQSEERVQNVSGVNLEEEAASLIRHEQGFQAAAQVISAAVTLFETLLSAIGG